jgi:hydroxymethylbilane synthase
MTSLLRLGTRRSPLALYQANLIADLLRAAHPGLTVELVTMDTRGDVILNVPLPQIGGKGLFTQELEEQLLDERLDLAVHSLKDLPSALPEGLMLGACPPRGNPADALVSHRWRSIAELPQNACVATGSVRRKAQLLSQRPDLQFQDLRGNIDTRLRKLGEQELDAIIMATTALERLGRTEPGHTALVPDTFVPAVAQGAIAVEIKQGRDDIAQLIAAIDHGPTSLATRAERVFMRTLEGGCSAPLAAHAAPAGDQWRFIAWVGAPDGQRHLRADLTGSDPVELAHQAAEDMLSRDARRLMGRT